MENYQEIVNEHLSKDFKDFAEKLTFKEFYETCERGDWMLWLFKKSNPDSLRELTLAKGHCANTIRHLMKDERALAAVDAAIAFGEGKINRDELDKAAAASAASYAAYAAYAASYAAYAASYAATAASAASYDDYAATAASAASYDDYAAGDDYSAADAARKQSELETSNICKEYLPIEIWRLCEEPKKEPKEEPKKSSTIAHLQINDKKELEVVEITQIRLHGKLYNLTEIK